MFIKVVFKKIFKKGDKTVPLNTEGTVFSNMDGTHDVLYQSGGQQKVTVTDKELKEIRSGR